MTIKRNRTLSILRNISLGYAPLSIAALLSINYSFSYSYKKEVFPFSVNYNLSRGVKVKNSLISIEDKEFSKYPSVGFFLDYNSIPDKRYVSFTTAEGILGYKVFKERTFE